MSFMEKSFLWHAIMNLTIASYIHDEEKANVQLKRMAKRYMRRTNSKLDQRVLRRVVKSPSPVLLVRISYEELAKTDSEHWS